MTELITAKHKVFGICEVPDTYPDLYPGDWVPVTGEVVEAVEPGNLFEPADHPLHGDGTGDNPLGVIDYLLVSDEAERTRVIGVEAARGDKARRTVLDWTPPPTV